MGYTYGKFAVFEPSLFLIARVTLLYSSLVGLPTRPPTIEKISEEETLKLATLWLK
jgi:hypothetical protein